MARDTDKPPLQPRDFFPSIPAVEEDSDDTTFEAMASMIQMAAKKKAN
jgi:hypothetical protein